MVMASQDSLQPALHPSTNKSTLFKFPTSHERESAETSSVNDKNTISGEHRPPPSDSIQESYLYTAYSDIDFETGFRFTEPIDKDRGVLMTVLGNRLGSKNVATRPFCTLLRSMLTAEELASEGLHKYQPQAFAIPSVLLSILYIDKWESIRTYGNVILALIPEWI